VLGFASVFPTLTQKARPRPTLQLEILVPFGRAMYLR